MAPAWRCAKRLATASLQLFSVRQGAKTTGRLNQERFNAKKIEEEVKNKIHVPPAKSSTGRRNKKNLRNVWRNVNWDNNDLVEVELVEGEEKDSIRGDEKPTAAKASRPAKHMKPTVKTHTQTKKNTSKNH